MNPIPPQHDPQITGSQCEEDIMSEFGQIFDSNLTVALYIYGSLVFAVISSAAALWVTRSRDDRQILLSYRHA
jgi:hypothetical protein